MRVDRKSGDHIVTDRQTILIVDDDPFTLEMHCAFFNKDHRVLSAPSGLVALDIASKEHPDLIILDVVMPKMGGYDALLEMRKINPAIKCIFTTGYDKMKVLQNQGVSDEETVLAKPYEVSELSRLIHDRLK